MGRDDSRDRRRSPPRSEPPPRSRSRSRGRDDRRRSRSRGDTRDRDRPRDERRDEERRRSRSRGGDRDRDDRRRSRSRSRGGGGGGGGGGRDDGDSRRRPLEGFTVKVEGPNDKHCYRVTCEVPKENGVKVSAAGPWQGDKRSAQRDEEKMIKAYERGGAEGIFKMKTELFRARHGRR
eukprot:TRINITY_DN6903_c0_g1_i1.p1 TRINITY_DN6903_c0_g1~~TRINITY_DN6903_c0_g1_i1.p1  ORF type:complete len:178 (+),score=29.71 TRINITY_DN6903_c0_g1_i1:64-597(+)